MSVSLKNKLVLVVDDEPLMCECLVDIFESVGAKVIQAFDGISAFELLKSNKVDILLSDIRMPGGDGYSLMKQIGLELNYKPMMYLCTGFSDVSVQDALAVGVLKVFDKPFNVSEMLDIIFAEVNKRL